MCSASISIFRLIYKYNAWPQSRACIWKPKGSEYDHFKLARGMEVLNDQRRGDK